MVLDISFSNELDNIDIDAINRQFAITATAGATRLVGNTLRGNGPYAVRKRTGLLRRGIRADGRANGRFAGSGLIGTVGVRSTGPHANPITRRLVEADVNRFAESRRADAAFGRIAEAAMQEAIDDNDPSSRNRSG